MKTFLITLVVLLSIGTTSAQDWQHDMEKAKELATQNDQPIILVFKGSDWCVPCIKLDKDIFSTKTFKQYAKSNVVLLEADFPKRKKNALSEAQQSQNNYLAERYNKRGVFPLVVVLDNNGGVLGETGFLKVTPDAYIAKLKSIYTK